MGSADGTIVGGIDFTKPIQIVSYPPPDYMYQYVKSHGFPGNWFDPLGTQSADDLGISGATRTKTKFKLPKGTGLQSQAKPILDTWITDTPVSTKGGGVQLFVNDKVKQTVIDLNNIKG